MCGKGNVTSLNFTFVFWDASQTLTNKKCLLVSRVNHNSLSYMWWHEHVVIMLSMTLTDMLVLKVFEEVGRSVNERLLFARPVGSPGQSRSYNSSYVQTLWCLCAQCDCRLFSKILQYFALCVHYVNKSGESLQVHLYMQPCPSICHHEICSWIEWKRITSQTHCPLLQNTGNMSLNKHTSNDSEKVRFCIIFIKIFLVCCVTVKATLQKIQ